MLALCTTPAPPLGEGTKDEPLEQLCLLRGWRSGESRALRAFVFLS